MDKFFALSKEKQGVILNAALQCFGRFGYEKTSMQDIAATAHISKASVFHYFGSKKALYLYLVKYSMDILLQTIGEADLDEKDLFGRILAAGRRKVNCLKEHPYVAAFVASFWEERASDVSQEVRLLKQNAGKIRNDLVLHPEDARKFRNPADAPVVYQMLLLMAQGIGNRRGDETQWDVVMEEFESYVAVLKRNFYREEYL